MGEQIELLRRRPCWHNPDLKKPLEVRRSFGWCRSGKKVGGYVHRVRSATIYYGSGKQEPWLCTNLWCGMSLLSPIMLPRFEEPAVLCATCEGRAIGAGYRPSREPVERPPMMYGARI